MGVEIILQHGWGFDSRAWTPWLPPLAAEGATVLCGERGYYGASPACPQFSPAARRRIIVAHSLGLHLVSKEALASADTIISFAGFLNFHGGDPLGSRRSRRVIKAMRTRFAEQPHAVLQDFMINCHAPAACPDDFHPPSQCDQSLLANDLQLLDECSMPASVLANKKVLLIHGVSDIIVPPAIAEELHVLVPGSERILIAGAGHALPFVNREAALLHVSRALETRETYVGSTNR